MTPRAMLMQIHQAGLTWKAIAHKLRVSSRDRLRQYATDNRERMRFTPEQQTAMQQLHAALYPGEGWR